MVDVLTTDEYQEHHQRHCDICAIEEELEKNYTCLDCGEVRYDEHGKPSARVEADMKCGVCTYEY